MLICMQKVSLTSLTLSLGWRIPCVDSNLQNRKEGCNRIDDKSVEQFVFW